MSKFTKSLWIFIAAWLTACSAATSTPPLDTQSLTESFATQTATPQSELYGKGKIAFVSKSEGSAEIYVMNADVMDDPIRLTTDGGSHPDWSPDGSRIAFSTIRDGNSEIYIMNRDGSNPVRITDDISFDGKPSWSPDGTKIAFISNRISTPPFYQDVYVMDADGTNVSQLYVSTDQGGGSFEDVISLDWSPDGTSIVAEVQCRTGLCSYLKVVNSDGTNLRTILTPSNLDKPYASGKGISEIFFSDPAWSPDGNKLIYSTSYKCNDLYFLGRESISLYIPNDTTFVYLTDPLCSSGSMASEPFWSPDGDMIVYVDGEEDAAEIYVMQADGSYIDRLTYNDVEDYAPVWTRY